MADTSTGTAVPTTENGVPVADVAVTARSASTHSGSVGLATQNACTAPVRSTVTRSLPATWSRTSREPASPSNGTVRKPRRAWTCMDSGPPSVPTKVHRGSHASDRSRTMPSSSETTSFSSGGSPTWDADGASTTEVCTTDAPESPRSRSTTNAFAGSA